MLFLDQVAMHYLLLPRDVQNLILWHVRHMLLLVPFNKPYKEFEGRGKKREEQFINFINLRWFAFEYRACILCRGQRAEHILLACHDGMYTRGPVCAFCVQFASTVHTCVLCEPIGDYEWALKK